METRALCGQAALFSLCLKMPLLFSLRRQSRLLCGFSRQPSLLLRVSLLRGELVRSFRPVGLFLDIHAGNVVSSSNCCRERLRSRVDAGSPLRDQLYFIVAKNHVHHARPIDEDQAEVHPAFYFEPRERLRRLDVDEGDDIDEV